MQITSWRNKNKTKQKEILWSVRSHLAIETRQLASSQWDHTLLFYKNQKKNKEGEENPKTKTRVFKKNHKTKEKRQRKNEKNNIEFPSNQLHPKLKGFKK